MGHGEQLTEADAQPTAERYRFGPFTLDLSRRLLLRDAQPVSLGSRAFELLAALVRSAGRTVSKAELFAAAWPGVAIEESNLRVHIAAIRRALNEGLESAIRNDPGRGYRFAAPVVPEKDRTSPAESTPSFSLEVEIIGRESAVVEIAALIPLRRFVTLTGTGGVGKTTVAKAVAARMAEHYRDGTLLLDFAVARQDGDLTQILAAALQVKAPEPEIARLLVAELRRRQMLLVFDNCEHLIEAITALAQDVRAQAPHIHLLATSREPMRAHGEWVYPISALAWPPEGAAKTLRELVAFPAAELLVTRLNALGYRPPLSDADVRHLATIARRLDGLPLAIELAAANAELFSIADLAERLDERLHLLTTGRRFGDGRHRTLEAMIGWSYDLLSPEQARAWRWLGAFAGEFGLADACTILRAAGIGEHRSAGLFFDLVSKSLVDRSVHSGGALFRLLESPRLFAIGKLVEAGELDAARRSHARAILSCVQGKGDRWDQPCQSEAQIDRSLADLRLAIGWALLDGGDIELGIDLTIASGPMWFKRLRLRELQAYLEEAKERIATGAPCGDAQIARLELALAHARFHQSGTQSAVEEGLLRSTEAALRAGDGDIALQALWALFGHASIMGDYVKVGEYTRRYEIVQAGRIDPLSRATGYRMRTLARHVEGRLHDALDEADRGLANLSFLKDDEASRIFQYDHRLATLAHRAKTLWLLGRSQEALDDCETILDTARNIDQPFGLGHALASSCCPVAIWHGDLDRAEVYVGTLLDLASGTANVWRSAGLLYRAAIDHLRGLTMSVPSNRVNAFYSDVLASLSADLLSAECWQRTQAVPEHWCTAEIHRARGEQLLAEGGEDCWADAEDHFQTAIAVARRQGAAAWALRALTSLATLRMGSGRPAPIEPLRALVAAFDGRSASRDLTAARAILGT